MANVYKILATVFNKLASKVITILQKYEVLETNLTSGSRSKARGKKPQDKNHRTISPPVKKPLKAIAPLDVLRPYIISPLKQFDPSDKLLSITNCLSLQIAPRIDCKHS